MGTEQRKAEVELAVFREFISKAGIGIDSASVRKHDGRSEPDISCTLSIGEQVAYELVEICSSDIAATFNKLRDGGAAGVVTSDPTEKTLRKKLHKTYQSTLPVELLCYKNGRTVSPDDQIYSETQLWVNAIDGPFRKVWLLGEKGVYEVWSAS
jgi:hypothetical protein